MRRFLISASAAGLVIFLTAPAAVAGGSWLEWDRFAYQVGDRVVATGRFGRGCCGRGTPEQGPFFAYLVPRDSARGEGLLPFGSIRLGEIEIERIDRYTWAGRLVFTVPKIEPGSYVVTHCNDPCTRELGDLLHPRIRIVENETETRLWRRIDALRDAVQARRYEIMRANVKFDELSERERIRLEALGNQLGQLRRASVARDPVEERSEFPWLLAGSAFAIGGAGGLMASVRRGRS